MTAKSKSRQKSKAVSRKKPYKKNGHKREITSLHALLADLEHEFQQLQGRAKFLQSENDRLSKLCGDDDVQQALRKFHALEPESRALIIGLIKKLHRKRKLHS